MKICAYCTEKNRDEAIFCRRCKRALRSAPVPKDNFLIWLVAGVVIVGLGTYLVSSRSFLALAAPGSPIADGTPTARSLPTNTPRSVTVSACPREGTINIRRGPGTHYETISGLLSGICLKILGRNQDASWVFMVSDDHKTGWVAASTLDIAGSLNDISIRDDSEMANAARPTLTSAEIAHGAQAYLTQVAATTLPESAFTRYVVPCFETVNRLGEEISCRIERAYCDYLPGLEGSPTFCNDLPAPDHTFALIVLGEDWSDYDGQCIIVSGHLRLDKGVLQIQASNRDQVSSCT